MSLESTGREAIVYFLAGTVTGVVIQVIRLFVYGAGQVIAPLYGVSITFINLFFGVIFVCVSASGYLSEFEEFLTHGGLFTLIVAIIAFSFGDYLDGIIAFLALVLSLIISALRSYTDNPF